MLSPAKGDSVPETMKEEGHEMTDDSNLTPGGASTIVTVTIREDAEGSWVDWAKDGETGSLGPYQDRETADNVRAAKERELTENARHIDDVR